MHASDDDFTRLIRLSGGRDPVTRARLIRRVYGDLHVIARSKQPRARLGEAPPPEPTTILHEAFLKVFPRGEDAEVRFDGRAHFFGIFSRAMDQFLIDWRRAQGRRKRGGGRGPGVLRGDEAAPDPRDGCMPDEAGDRAVDDRWRLLGALAELGGHAPLAADVVWLRYGHGLSLDETARELGIAPRTVSKYWNFARAWLRRRLDGGTESGPREGLRVLPPADAASPPLDPLHAAARPLPDDRLER